MSSYSYNRRRYRRFDWFPVICVTAVIAVLVAVGGYMTLRATSGKDVASVTVCSKERAAKNGGGEYRIYTDHGTYTMKDVLFLGGHRTNTADDYGKLKINTTYDIHTVGWRNGLFSSFPNITKFTKSATQNPAACN